MSAERLFQRIAWNGAVMAGMALAGGAASAAPAPWEASLQEPISPIGEMVVRFNHGTQIVIVLITLFVLALLLYVMWRFNAKRHPVPTRTSHNTLVEVVWTVVPVLILVGIAIPSFALLFAEYDPARAITGYDPAKDKPLTIKVTGNQWFWSYEYPDNDGVSFDSRMLTDDQRTDPANQPRLLAVNNEMVVPQGVVVRLQVTGADVIHSFAMQPLGIKTDAVPGRLNETWFRADKPGIYYGQCSELCGKDHAFMPIAMRVVPQDKFTAWVTAAKTDLHGAYQSLQASLTESRDTAVASR
jgi:cytochrome c oxidase subunit 2